MKKKAKKAAKKSTVKKTVKKSISKKPNRKNNERKKKKQKTRTKTTGKVPTRSNKKSGLRTSKSQKAVPKKKRIPKSKSAGKTVHPNKVRTKPQRRSSKQKTTKSDNVPNVRISGTLEVSKQTKQTKDRINYTFKKIRAVDKKLALFKAKGNQAINKQLKKFGGKPPRGIVVTVTDKNGREKTEISRFDFVVNEKNTVDFVNDMLKRMKDDFMEWVEMEENGEPQDDLDKNPYGDYNPDSIASIQIKFIYNK